LEQFNRAGFSARKALFGVHFIGRYFMAITQSQSSFDALALHVNWPGSVAHGQA
jgi:hypothetical protein